MNQRLREALAFPFFLLATFFAWIALASWITRNKVKGVDGE